MKLCLGFFCFIFLFSCKTSTKVRVDKTSTSLSNNEVVVVEKTNVDTKTYGALTNIYYGTSHRFTYVVKLLEKAIHWDGKTAEPKTLLFKKDSIFIHFLKEVTVSTPYLDTISNTTKYNYHYEVQRFYQKHIDKRYFFNLLGKDYWIDISEGNYQNNLVNGEEFKLKNDNELTIPLDSLKPKGLKNINHQ